MRSVSAAIDQEAFTRKAEAEARAIQVKIDEYTQRHADALSRIVKVHILKGGEAYIQRREIKTHITIHVKVFHGARATHSFEVSILDRIQVLIDKLGKADGSELSYYHESRLVYPMGYLRNLSTCLQETFLDQHIPDGAKLVLVGRRSFAWDIDAKGPNIKLYNNNLTANKSADSVEYETVLGGIAIGSGKHYWEIKIEKFVELDDIIIGVS